MVNKAPEEVLFFLVTLFGKQSVSREDLVEVQRHFQGHGIEEAGGRRGFVLVVTSCPERGATRGQKVADKKGQSETSGFKRRLWMGGLCLTRHHTSLFSHSGGQRGQTSLWPLIYLYAWSSLCTERETHEMHLSKY